MGLTPHTFNIIDNCQHYGHTHTFGKKSPNNAVITHVHPNLIAYSNSTMNFGLEFFLVTHTPLTPSPLGRERERGFDNVLVGYVVFVMIRRKILKTWGNV